MKSRISNRFLTSFQRSGADTGAPGIGRTLKEAEFCADPTLIADMRKSLRLAKRRFYSALDDGGLEDAEEHLEEIARSAMRLLSI